MPLLPEVGEDHVGPNNSVCFIEAFVDVMELQPVGFARLAPKATGRPRTIRLINGSASGEYVVSTHQRRMTLAPDRFIVINDGLSCQLMPGRPCWKNSSAAMSPASPAMAAY